MRDSRAPGILLCLALAVTAFAAMAFSQGDSKTHDSLAPALTYEKDGSMHLPSHYREWVYLSSGFNMSYREQPAASSEPDNPVFDNVFVDPASYKAFCQKGTWPDKTVLILEIRKSENKASINKAGHFQSSVNAVEAHIKDEHRFPGGWAFFGFKDAKNGTLIPPSASCYSCHSEHAAVDTTFVQFYPTLMPIAQKLATLSHAYQKETR